MSDKNNNLYPTPKKSKIHNSLFKINYFLPLLLIPLYLWWGNHPSDQAYTLLTAARTFTPGLWIDPDFYANTERTIPLTQPLTLALLNLSNTPLRDKATAIALTALGWLLTTFLFTQLIYNSHQINLSDPKPNTPKIHPLSFILLPSLLLLLHPSQFAQLGTGLTLITAAALLLLHTQTKGKDLQIALATFLTFTLWLHWTTTILLLIILIHHATSRPKKFLPLTTLITLLATSVILLTTNHYPLTTSSFLPQYLHESNLYILFIPLCFIGLLRLRKDTPLTIWLIWTGFLLISTPPLAHLALAISIIWLLALALQAITDQTILNPPIPAIIFATLTVCLAFAYTASYRFRHTLRPTALVETESQLLSQIRTDETAITVATTPRLAYQLGDSATAVTSATDTTIRALLQDTPDLLLLPAAHMEREISNNRWISQRFHPPETLDTYKLYRKRDLPTDTASLIPTVVTTTFGTTLVGTKIAPLTIPAGGRVDIQLDWQTVADTPTPHGTVLNLTHPINGTPYAQIDTITPTSLTNRWLTNGTIAPSYYDFTTIPEIAIGAYPLTLILHDDHGLAPTPLFKQGEANELDRVVLAHIAVPWQGETAGELLDTPFSDGIVLHKSQIEGELTPNGVINATFYWQTTATPTQNYTVFLHFLDSQGNYITGSDSVPFDGRYPTQGWHPGDTIPSQHILFLPPDLPDTTYQIKVGLYNPITGQRIAVGDGDSLLLQKFEK